MFLDSDFRRAVIRVANGDGSREYAKKLTKELRGVAAELGRRYHFADCVKKYGREKVALCVAATMVTQHGYELQQVAWASSVFGLWQNRYRSLSVALINLHPAILADVSRSLRMLTTEGLS